MRSKKREKIRQIVHNRFDKLFEQAERVAREGELRLANRYVEIARKLGMRHNLSIPTKHKHRFCKHCYSYFTSDTSRVRTRRSKLVIYCRSCGKYTRIPFLREVKARRR